MRYRLINVVFDFGNVFFVVVGIYMCEVIYDGD